MAIEIGTNWPVMAVTPPNENPPQKRSIPGSSLQNPEDSIVMDGRIELESNAPWEKGTFVDFYI